MALMTLLVSLYSDAELRQLASVVFGDRSYAALLPGVGASARQLASELVVLIQRDFRDPPEEFWSYLYSTRPRRTDEIDPLHVYFRPREPASKTALTAIAVTTLVDAPLDSLRLSGAVNGTCDLIAVIGVARASHGPGWFPALVPGMVNGLERTLGLSWTARAITIEATPSLYSELEPRPSSVVLEVPRHGESLRYFPDGRNGYKTVARPSRVDLVIDWDMRARRLMFDDVAGKQQFSIEFV